MMKAMWFMRIAHASARANRGLAMFHCTAAQWHTIAQFNSGPAPLTWK
jgi:hypothetical protein